MSEIEHQRSTSDSADSQASLPDGRGSELGDVLAYFITYHTYGTWLHGDERGSVDRKHNRLDTERLPPNAARECSARHRLKSDPVVLKTRQRQVVEATIREEAAHRGWFIHALTVRTNHVHVVVTANATPEKVMNDFKSWATRMMV